MENYEELMKNPDDPRYGEITILYNPTNPSDRIVKKTKKYQNKDIYKENIKIGQRRFSANHQNLLYLKDIQINDEDLEILYIYEYLDDFLDLKKLSDSEIIILFKDILKSIIHLKSYEMFHGDIRPDFIVFDKDNNNFILIDNLKHDLDPISCQIENIDSYRTLYLSPRFFDMILSQKDDISFGSKDEIFSLGFLCLGKYEEIENFQEFYNFDEEKFDFDLFEEKVDLICKRNYDVLEKIFLNFLKSYVFVRNDNRKSLSAEELLVVLKSIPEFKELFQFDSDMQITEVDKEILKDIPEMDNLKNEEQSNYQHYNPFDFVKLDTLKEDNRRISELDNNSRTDSFRKKMDSLINLNDNVRIHQLAEEQNLFVISKSEEILENPEKGNFKKNKNVEEKIDVNDVLKQINFFKLKLSLNKISEKEKENQNFYNIDKSEEIIKNFEKEKKEKSAEVRKNRLISITNQKRENNYLEESIIKKNNIDVKNKDDYNDYLKSIGLDSQIFEEEERVTEMLDKKIRETVPREDNEVFVKKNENLSLSKFLKKNVEEDVDKNFKKKKDFEKNIKDLNFKKNKKEDNLQEEKIVLENDLEKKNENLEKEILEKKEKQEIIIEKKENDIEDMNLLLKQENKNKDLEIVNQKIIIKNEKIREKSARKMISKNFMILKFNKPPEILNKKRKKLKNKKKI